MGCCSSSPPRAPPRPPSPPTVIIDGVTRLDAEAACRTAVDAAWKILIESDPDFQSLVVDVWWSTVDYPLGVRPVHHIVANKATFNTPGDRSRVDYDRDVVGGRISRRPDETHVSLNAIQPHDFYRLIVTTRPVNLDANNKLRGMLADNYLNFPVIVIDQVPPMEVEE